MKSVLGYFGLIVTLTFFLSPVNAADVQVARILKTPWSAALSSSGAQAVSSTFFLLKEIAEYAISQGFDKIDKKKALRKLAIIHEVRESSRIRLADLALNGNLSKDDAAIVQQLAQCNELIGKAARSFSTLIQQPSGENDAAYGEDLDKAGRATDKLLRSLGDPVPPK